MWGYYISKTDINLNVAFCCAEAANQMKTNPLLCFSLKNIFCSLLIK